MLKSFFFVIVNFEKLLMRACGENRYSLSGFGIGTYLNQVRAVGMSAIPSLICLERSYCCKKKLIRKMSAMYMQYMQYMQRLSLTISESAEAPLNF